MNENKKNLEIATPEPSNVMEYSLKNGGTATVQGNIMTIQIPLDPNAPLTSTGRSVKLYSTGGWEKLNSIMMNLTVIEPLRNKR